MIRRVVPAVLLVVGLLAAGCSDSDDDEGATSATTAATVASSATTAADATTTTAAADPLTILVTNDDGVGAPGIDAVVQALVELPDTEVIVVAPAENNSGTGGSTTDGAVETSETTTASGYPAVAVEGFPADSVNWALDGGIDVVPDLVVSGINEGQNIGPLVEVSGTVGAARAAFARGIPALAASQGLGDPVDFPAGVDQVVAWVSEHRAELAGGDAEPFVVSINIPSCPTGAVRGVVEVPVAADVGGRNATEVDCTSTATDPVDDIDGFITGWATLSDVAPA